MYMNVSEFTLTDELHSGSGNSTALKLTRGNGWAIHGGGYIMKWQNGVLSLPSMEIRPTDQTSSFKGSVVFNKDLRVYGTKNSTVHTESYGQRLLNAYETPEYYFADYGEAVTGDDGKVRVDIDPMFAETVNLSRYMTHVTPTELVLCAVTHEDIDHFTIETSKPNVLVRWNLVAHRLGYEDVRLKEDAAYDSTVDSTVLDQKRF